MNKLLAIITVTTVLTGCMESSSFSVRDSNEAILERFKWAQNQQLKQNYNDGVSASSDSDFQQFLNGDAQLSCGVSCAWDYGAKRTKLKQLYSNKEWSELASLVLEANHETDQAYYYLGSAAEGLSRPSAAMVYFDRARTVSQKCDTLLINVCDDLDVPTLSRFGINRVSQKFSENKDETTTKWVGYKPKRASTLLNGVEFDIAYDIESKRVDGNLISFQWAKMKPDRTQYLTQFERITMNCSDGSASDSQSRYYRGSENFQSNSMLAGISVGSCGIPDINGKKWELLGSNDSNTLYFIDPTSTQKNSSVYSDGYSARVTSGTIIYGDNFDHKVTYNPDLVSTYHFTCLPDSTMSFNNDTSTSKFQSMMPARGSPAEAMRHFVCEDKLFTQNQQLKNNHHVSTGKLTLKAPDVAENGTVVPVTMSLDVPLEAGDKLYLDAGDGNISHLVEVSGSITLESLSVRVRKQANKIKARVIRANGGEIEATKYIDGPVDKSVPTYGSNTGSKCKKRKKNDQIKMLCRNDMAMKGFIESVVYNFPDGQISLFVTPYASKNPYFGLKGGFNAEDAEVTIDTSTVKYTPVFISSRLNGLQANDHSRNYLAKTTTTTQSKLRRQDNSQITSDNIKPTLRITGGNSVSVTSKFFNLEGTVSDASGIAELAIDGNPAQFDASGTFTLRRFLPIGETTLRITATDIYGNTATEQVVVTRTSAKANSFASEPTLGAPQKKASENSNAIALIIGIDEYSKAPRAKHAENDARLFYDYASTSLGIPAHRIKLLTGNKATRVNILSELLWLESTVIENETEVLLYFAGHGLGVPDGNNTFLFTHDSLPTLPKETGLDREELLLKIAQTKPKSTLVFLDTCYSGSGRGGEENLVADSRALVIRPRDIKAPEGFSLFSAASGRQLANSHPQQKNGLFSYYVMRGLNGEADANKDDQLTASELQQYVLSNVKRSANFYGRPQTPELIGDATRVIADWRKNAPSKASSKGPFLNLFN